MIQMITFFMGKYQACIHIDKDPHIFLSLVSWCIAVIYMGAITLHLSNRIRMVNGKYKHGHVMKWVL